MTSTSLAEAPQAVLQRVAGVVRPVVLLDGPSGAGKTSLAAVLAERWTAVRGDTLQVVSLDDVYPGWHGLAAGSASVPTIVAEHGPGYRRWDWAASEPADWVGLDARLPVLVEGCGALTTSSAPLATCRIWLDLDESTRRHRALARDKGGYDPYWDLWAAQERVHWQHDRPWTLADLVVAGA